MSSQPSAPGVSRASDGASLERNQGALTFSAVVLAAGLSRRMGEPNKLLLGVGGEPMVKRAVQTVLAAGFGEVVVVLGYQAEDVGAALSGLGVATVHNPAFESGQVSSVRAGLAALPRPSGAVFVCLADQPLVTAADLRQLMMEFARRSHGSILVPFCGERRGNPVVIDWASAQETLQRGTNFGCRHFMQEHPERVYRLQTQNEHFVRDIDEPGDYRSLIEQARR